MRERQGLPLSIATPLCAGIETPGHCCAQDLAVVVLLMLIPLLAPSDTGAAGFSQIAKVRNAMGHRLSGSEF